jgi:GntR family transcriptional repressor for pyruvate dehydrogenase complex
MRKVGTSGLSAADTAMGLIRERIADNEFPPNSRLPRETELAASLGVSRNALREAIRALGLVGVLESKHGSGTFVTSLEPRDLLRGLDYSNGLLSFDSAIALAEFRRVTEPAACAMACERSTPQQRTGIRDLLDAMQQVNDPTEYARLDPQFHQAIVEASGNSVLIAVSSALTHGSGWIKMWHAVTSDVIPERTRQEHRYLVTAIETGDRELALAIANAHIAKTQSVITRAFTAGEGR